MESIRPQKPKPIPLHGEPNQVRNILLRLAGLLVLAVAAMGLIYLR
jgi:hypothetical protein